MKRLPSHLVAYQRERARSGRRPRRGPVERTFRRAPEPAIAQLAALADRLRPAANRLHRFGAWAAGFGDVPPPAHQIRALATAWLEADAAGVYVPPGVDPRVAIARAGAEFFGVDRTVSPASAHGLEVGQQLRLSGLSDALAPAPPCRIPIRAVLSALMVARDAELEGRHDDAWTIRGDAARAVIAALRAGGVRRCHVGGARLSGYVADVRSSVLTGMRWA